MCVFIAMLVCQVAWMKPTQTSKRSIWAVWLQMAISAPHGIPSSTQNRSHPWSFLGLDGAEVASAASALRALRSMSSTCFPWPVNRGTAGFRTLGDAPATRMNNCEGRGLQDVLTAYLNIGDWWWFDSGDPINHPPYIFPWSNLKGPTFGLHGSEWALSWGADESHKTRSSKGGSCWVESWRSCCLMFQYKDSKTLETWTWSNS